MVELVDTLVLEASAVRRAGSSPVPGTILVFVAVAAAAIPFLPPISARPNLQFWMIAANIVLAIVGAVFSQRFNETVSFAYLFRRAHIVQMLAQSSIYFYMALYSPVLRESAFSIVYQLVFAFLADAMICAYLRKPISIGFAVFPIVLSVNFFLWFKGHHYYLQLACILFAVASKHFLVRPDPAGGVRHIFNPSGIALAVFSLFVLIGGHQNFAQLPEVIETHHLARPGIFFVIFMAGCFSLYFGKVVSVTLGAFLTLYITSEVARFFAGGVPLMHQWIDPSLLLGITLLITDPKTSPDRPLAQFAYGCLYAIGVMLAYGLLSLFQQPGFFLKVLPVPVLNLLVPWLNRTRWLQGPFPSGGVYRWGLHLTYAVVFFTLIRLGIESGRQSSWLGRLGGIEWSKDNRR